MSADSIGTAILTGGAGQAIGSLVGPAAGAGTGIYIYLKRKYEYIKNLGQNFENLVREARYLSTRREDVNDLIAKNKVIMEKTRECATWLEDVEIMTRSVEDMETRYQMSSSGSCGLCRLRTRLKLSREIVKMTKSVVDLRDRMNLEHVLLTERNPDRVEKKYPKTINEVPSLSENVEKLLEFLKDDDIKKIGIWGMSGVGKTTILENLNDEVEKLQIFDIVLWVTVSKECSLHQMQQTILKRLGVKVEGIDNENQAATLISKSLESKKYLLLLDEVFSEINLRQIGIHDSHLQGKVVLATRERIICSFMEVDEEIKVERLSRDDARKLFRDAVGEVIDHPHIKPIAERVLKQCGELPYLIRVVGRHLKDKSNEDLWQSTLSKLRSPNMYPLKHLDDVINVFKVIYEELHDPLKHCLLYGASFPEDHEIYRDYLIECWKVEELIGIGETLRKTREEGHTKLDILIEKCLFDDRCKSTKYVKMPIIFRTTALRMAYQHNFGLLLRDNEEFENHLSDEKWTNAKVISLMNSNLNVLPERPECSMISTLFLQKNENLSVIPRSFFDCMSSLKILDLCGTGIECLPSSICHLTNLRGVYLNDCYKLTSLPKEIGKLKNLEVLDISRTRIIGLPTMIGKLTNLRCLRLSFSSAERDQNHVAANGIDVSQPKIIQQLLQLEELTIDVDPREPYWNKIAPEIAAEVANLAKLSALSFYFPSIESLETFIQTSISWRNGTPQPGSNFRSFNFCVGSYSTNKLSRLDVSKCKWRRSLQYTDGKDIPNVINEVLRRTCAFKLIGHKNITKLSDFGNDGLECLESCLVEGCTTMTNIVESHMPEAPFFTWLRELHLCKLEQLYDICHGPVAAGSFAKLTTLTLFDCPNMTKVVSWELSEQLRGLQHLRVENCPKVTEIIEVHNQITGASVLPKLKILELVTLEALVSIHSNDLFEWRDLQKIEIIKCDKLVNLCLSTMNAMKLNCIRCTEAWWGSLMLDDEVKKHLHGFCCFVKV